MSIKVVHENKKAWFDYEIMDRHEAGVVLTGSEVKSLRAGNAQLKDSFVEFYSGEMFLQNAHISVYKQGGYSNHLPERRRKLLMKRAQIERLYAQVKEKGLTIIPLKIYFKDGFVKLEIALAKGKKLHDKRDAIKTRDVNRELNQRKRKG